MQKILISLAILGLVLFPVTSFALTAADTGLSETGHQAGYVTEDGTGPDLTSFIITIVNVVLSLSGLILLVLVIYGGIMWMTALGDKEKVTKARQHITNAIIGLIIVVAAAVIANYVIAALIVIAT